MPLLTVTDLTKDFGGLRAVSRLSFDAEPGEILGLIGPNGAGKTTVFNLVTGFLRPTAGRILLAGRSVVGLAAQVLERVGLQDKLDSRAADLTLGEQKRLEIARALATDPRLLLLDEPMGGLNPREVNAACALVEQIRADGVSVILVEHVMKAIMRISNRIVVIHHGEKIADGPPERVVNDPGVIAAYLGTRVV